MLRVRTTIFVYFEMKFFDRFIGMFNRESPFPNRQLRLQYVPAPASMPLFARQYAELIWQNDKFQLDYSPATVRFVDAFLQRFRDAGITAHNFAETIFVAGAYLGQVMVQHAGAQWVPVGEAGLPANASMMTVVLRLPNGTVADPVSKAFKRFHYGEKESLEKFYLDMCQPGAK